MRTAKQPYHYSILSLRFAPGQANNLFRYSIIDDASAIAFQLGLPLVVRKWNQMAGAFARLGLVVMATAPWSFHQKDAVTLVKYSTGNDV